MTETICGFAFPFRIDPDTGGVARSEGADKLKENLKQILLTEVGERIMRRDYGGGLWSLVNDPNNSALRAIAQHQVAKSIAQWEPRVVLQEVTVTQEDKGEGMLWIHLKYIDRTHQNTDALSVPFGLGSV